MSTELNRQQCWQELQDLALPDRRSIITDLFFDDDSRANIYRISHAGITLDYSKNTVDKEVFKGLANLFDACSSVEALRALTDGEWVNSTEQRPALHAAIRAATSGEEAPERELIVTQYARAASFADGLHTGQCRGYSGETITDVVNIGIGGSDLGPRMVTEALKSYCDGAARVHFVSSLDGQELEQKLLSLQPESTLFLVSSKSFTTEETLCNAHSAIAWFRQRSGQSGLGLHFAAITGQGDKATLLGIERALIFEVPEWIGGRYSIWSSSGLPAMIAVGSQRFGEFLAGARTMDKHAANRDLSQNMPAILAALEVWHCNFLNFQSLAVVPYSYSLRLLPAYLQQLTMESNGKSCSRTGTPLDLTTAPVVWGTAGTEGQHSYHQLLHQGTHTIPVDFILPLRAQPRDRAKRLASHCLAQSKALMEGKTREAAYREMLDQGLSQREAHRLAAHKHMPGNRPSNTLLMNALTPTSLGALIALYEHKTFFTSVIWDINPFDQWGVELGKQLGKEILAALEGEHKCRFDPSTDALIALVRHGEE